jgi:Protein of unknown function (DUF416)
MLVFDEKVLTERLKGMDPLCRTAFALACAERLFPLYALNSARSSRGAPGRLRSTLDENWGRLIKGGTACEQPFLQEYDYLLLEPEAEGAQADPLGPLAEDAVAALAYACRSQVTGEPANAMWAARRGYEAVDYIAHTLEGMDYDTPEGEHAILTRRYVQMELRSQLRDIEELARVSNDRQNVVALVEKLRKRASDEGSTLAAKVDALV